MIDIVRLGGTKYFPAIDQRGSRCMHTFLKKQVSDAVRRSGLVALVALNSFNNSCAPTLSFLSNECCRNRIALKGWPGVRTEFFLDSHPKAIGIGRKTASSIGIDLPQAGILDPQKTGDIDVQELRKKILSGITSFGLHLLKLQKLSELKFREENWIKLDEETSLRPSALPLDLRILDEKGQENIVATFENSPVVSDRCRILGVGPETIRVWKKVIDKSSSIIVMGDITNDLEPIFEGKKDAEIIQVDGEDTLLLFSLSQALLGIENSFLEETK